MVKLGSNLCDKKLEKQPSADDGFDNIPLITPLEVKQLQHPFPDKVIVKTTSQYQLRQKKQSRLYVPGSRHFNINFYSEVSEKAKLTGLILITLAFLTSLLLLLMYKAMWYNQLTCPEGFVLKISPGPPASRNDAEGDMTPAAEEVIRGGKQQKHCTPAGVELYYTDQEVEQQAEVGGARGGGGGTTAGLYATLAQLNQAKRTRPELSLPWLPVINGLKEAKTGGVAEEGEE